MNGTWDLLFSGTQRGSVVRAEDLNAEDSASNP